MIRQRIWQRRATLMSLYIWRSISQARMQPTSSLAACDNAETNWFVCGANAFVAVIPRDEASTAFLQQQNKFKGLIPADIFVSTYRIRGKLWSPNKVEAGLEFVRFYARFVVQDAQIDCFLPRAKLQGLNIPFVVVRNHLLQCAAVRPA